ncbi:MAG TPA: carbohydrate binding family 9 domain-containing protein, partial [Tenuifilaceae bacterium]|nr:carbohydrate binding family 9 domain-containing protein [Tenuifilaceae bacterium]
MYKLLPPFCIAILLFAVQPAQAFLDEDKKICQAVRVNPKPPVVDGSLDDEVWEKGEWSGNFIQHEPYNGNEPSQKSYFKILYDSDYLYAAFKMSDSEPDKVVSRITRRDDADGDRVTLCIDSYFDQRTAFLFTTNAAGVKSDEVMTENGDKEDMNWDPIWWAKAVKTPDGWTAEMKIPLNQLRFANSSDMKWGVQVMRYIYRNQETDLWQHVPKDAPGFVHLFGELHGLNGLAPKRQVEVAPYMVTKTERLEAESGN